MIEILLVIIAAYVFLNMDGLKPRIIIAIMIGGCWAGTFLWFCETNEFIFLTLSFTSIGVYNISRMLENYFLQGISASIKALVIKWR